MVIDMLTLGQFNPTAWDTVIDTLAFGQLKPTGWDMVIDCLALGVNLTRLTGTWSLTGWL